MNEAKPVSGETEWKADGGARDMDAFTPMTKDEGDGSEEKAESRSGNKGALAIESENGNHQITYEVLPDGRLAVDEHELIYGLRAVTMEAAGVSGFSVGQNETGSDGESKRLDNPDFYKPKA